MAREVSEKTIYPTMARVLRNPRLWVAAFVVALLVIIHYHEAFVNIPVLEQIGSILGFGLSRHTLERILFLIPVAYGAATLGTGGGISLLVLVAAAMLPRVFIFSAEPREAIFETGGVIVTGLLVVLFLDALQKAKHRLTELEAVHNALDSQIRKLSMLHVISSTVSQSLELEQTLTAVNMMRQLTQTETSWLYLWDEEKKWLKLVNANGLPKPNLPQIATMGEGPDGTAAQTRRPAIIETTSTDSEFTVLKQRDLQSVLVVPLVAKGEMLGTLGVGTRLAHHFPPDEIDLLRATADQLSMAIDNARLYERERSVVEALRVSERNYRELFENASDSLWVHDLSGKVIAANSAFERLTGYNRDALIGANVSLFLSSHGQVKIDKEAHEVALRGEPPEPYEQEMVRKDNKVVIVQIGTSLIIKDGHPWAFQHIARDITEQKRAQENLRFYVQQVSQAQEAERKRIARELHDGTAQSLVAISRSLDELASGKSKASVQDIREQVRNVLREVRQFSQQLRPSILDDLGLLPAVRWLASDLTKNYGIATDVEVTGTQRQLSPEAELMIFRIVQEALTNVQKHANADRVNIKVEFVEHNTKVTISDNGKGFEMPARVGDLARIGKLGLAGMQERAQLLGGVLTMDSQPGKGTTVSIGVPF